MHLSETKPNLSKDNEAQELEKQAKGEYHKEVEERSEHGLISNKVRNILDRKQFDWGISDEDAKEIEEQVLKPFRQYEHFLNQEIHPLSEERKASLRTSGKKLGLEDEDMVAIETRVFKAESERKQYSNQPQKPLAQVEVFEFDVVTLNSKGKEINRIQKPANFFTEDLGSNTSLEMVEIPGGTFEFQIELLKIENFFMSKFPITQAQWKVVAEAELTLFNEYKLNPKPSDFEGDNRPVERVSWYDACEFCKRLSAITGRQYRLPSEAEWEYACRAHTTTDFHFGSAISPRFANYAKFVSDDEGFRDEGVETTPVGNFQVANAFGLYDMHGNVHEWCDDKVLRGGSWNSVKSCCSSAYQFKLPPHIQNHTVGFRVVWSPSQSHTTQE